MGLAFNPKEMVKSGGLPFKFDDTKPSRIGLVQRPVDGVWPDGAGEGALANVIVSFDAFLGFFCLCVSDVVLGSETRKEATETAPAHRHTAHGTSPYRHGMCQMHVCLQV